MAEGEFWKWVGRLLLTKNLYVWLWPFVGGPMTFSAIFFWSRAKHLSGPEIFTLALVCLVFGLALPPAFVWFKDWLRPRVKGRIDPVDVQSLDAKLMFTNNGVVGEFIAKCRFVGQESIPNSLPVVKFDLQWVGAEKRELRLSRGDSAHFLVASWVFDEKNLLAAANLNEFAAGKIVPQGYFGWSVQSSTQRLPSYDLEISILSPSAKAALVRYFTLKPKTHCGPLALTEYTPTDPRGRRLP